MKTKALVSMLRKHGRELAEAIKKFDGQHPASAPVKERVCALSRDVHALEAELIKNVPQAAEL